MKTKILVLFIIVLLFGCGEENVLSPLSQATYREVAYNSLDEQSKASITINWKDAKVEEGKYIMIGESHIIKLNSGDEIHFHLSEGNIITQNHSLGVVIFNTSNDALLGPIMIIVDPAQIKAVGFVGRM